MYKNKDP